MMKFFRGCLRWSAADIPYGDSLSMPKDNAAHFKSVWSDLKALEFTQGYLTAAGVRTRVLMAGNRENPLLLCLHGVGGHAEAYVRNLAAHSEHFWIVAIDMLGHGWTDKPAIDYQVADYANHVADVMTELGRKRAHLSGESLGGWVATWLAVNAPERVERLVLNTAGGWTAHPEVMARLKRLATEATTDPSWENIKARLEFLMFDKTSVSDDLIETRRAIYAQPGYAETMQRINCLQEMHIRRRNMITEAQYRSIKAPTLVVWTSHDPTATPAEGAQIAAMIPNSRFIVMNECGHWPQFENAELFNRVHIQFLRGQSIDELPGVRVP